jgi:AcrR family transcriptional regulator
VNAVGVDRIVAEAGVAKTTLYRHFRSKENLIVAVLARHDELWTRAWLEPEVARRADSPVGQLLAVFDAFADWCRQPSYPGCFFTNSILEVHDQSSEVRAAALQGMKNTYEFLCRLTREAGARDPEGLAHQLHLLMRGSIVAGVEREFAAVQEARVAAQRLLERASDGG